MELCLKKILIPRVSYYSRARLRQKESFNFFFPADLWKTGLYDYIETRVTFKNPNKASWITVQFKWDCKQRFNTLNTHNQFF